jgi:hypothetical protein
MYIENIEFYNLTNEEKLKIFYDKILPDYQKEFNLKKSNNPIAKFTGGLPGSGKSQLVNRWIKEDKKILTIDVDQLRKYHPKYKEIQIEFQTDAAKVTHEAASSWAKILKKYAENEKINYILDGSLKNPDNAIKKIKDSLDAGYRVEVNIIATNPYEAAQGALIRYADQYKKDKNTARLIKYEDISKMYDSTLDTIDKINTLDIEYAIYTRELEKIYEKSNKNTSNPKEIVLNYNNNMEQSRIKKLDALWNNTIKELEKANVPQEVIDEAKELYSNFKKSYLVSTDKDISKAKATYQPNLFDYAEYVEKENREEGEIEEKKEVNKTKSLPSQPSKAKEKKLEIDDFGEKIGGARKDNYKEYTHKVIDRLDEIEAIEYIKKANFWNSPKYEDLKEKGFNADTAVFIRNIYTATSPSLSKAHANDKEARKAYFDFINDMKSIINSVPVDSKPNEVSKHILKEFSNRGYLEKVGEKDYKMDTKFKELYNLGYIKKTFLKRVTFDLNQKLKNDLKNASWDKLLSKKDQLIRRESIRSKVKKLEYLEEYKRIGENATDYRNGKDVTVEEFWKKFQLRAGEFGNYMSQKERQKILNATYDAFLDLAKVLNIEPEAIGLNGNLAIAFGARGKGGIGAAAAHYEKGKRVINLTKFKGGGSLAHEWFHALDNYINARTYNKTVSPNFSTKIFTPDFNDTVKIDEVYKKARDLLLKTSMTLKYRNIFLDNEDLKKADSIFEELQGLESDYKNKRKFKEIYKQKLEKYEEAIGKTDYYKTSLSLDDYGKKKRYYSLDEEMGARAFESYVLTKMQENKMRNDFLVNPVKEEPNLWAQLEIDYPYPKDEDRKVFNKEFDKVFNYISGGKLLSKEIDTNRDKKVDTNIEKNKDNKISADKKPDNSPDNSPGM